MKKNKMKHSIYIRIFSTFLLTYMVLMIGFTAFLVSMEKEAAGKEFGNRAQQINDRVEEILNNNIDNDKQIIDLADVKKEFVEKSPVYLLNGAETAIFTSDYELIYSTYSTKDYWKCIYREFEKGKQSKDRVGLLKIDDWFSEEEIKKLENYLYAKPKAENVGDLAGYSIHIDSFWVDDEMIIPHSISASRMYACEFDEEGNVTSRSGTISKGNFYFKDYNNIKNLPYYEFGSIIPEYNENLNSKNQDELREMVTDESNLMNYLQPVEKWWFPNYIKPVERVNILTYRYYLVVPYQNSIRMLDDQSLYSEFYTAVGIDINIWERISSTLIYVWISCLIVFGIASLILSNQTYKTYLKKEKIEKQRKETTDALAHDLKTPLSIISGYAQNLQEDVHTEKREHYASNIQKNVERMDKIIHQMLDMSKLESDSFKIEFDEVSLSEISSKIINRYKSICDEKSITVSIAGEAVIQADKILLERVVDNFFINAIENTLEGGKINIEIIEDTFEVYNSGSHIPEDIIKDIWLPFKRGDKERGNTKGTGLGLSIARSILELHKFSYGVKNKEDGAAFWFKFK
ncbi:sensor histidine kinase [Sedimentibacter sp. MB31-C6]|uniref:sensor histidine kinase n=1 Tax=Sedimentibacter sp. MB31-C6 TaxID=3109366 RepID=UPI002DDD970F|nr:HAMP domain-containing sensor histidine kinase [Sedimentibacter sp. MB36-C1]WSI04584.1 HAMP domain-containing sensor histidine kinase [Sedimentibacter sp. MB36-C1]